MLRPCRTGRPLHFHEIGVSMKKMNPENMILLLCIVITLVFIVLMLLSAGCSSQKATKVHVLCVGPEGQVFHAEGMSVHQSRVIDTDVKLGACDVNVHEIDGSSQSPRE